MANFQVGIHVDKFITQYGAVKFLIPPGIYAGTQSTAEILSLRESFPYLALMGCDSKDAF